MDYKVKQLQPNHADHIGYFDSETESIVKISNVNHGTDKERNLRQDNWSDLKIFSR